MVRRYIPFFVLLGVVTIYWLSSVLFLDPDFGLHIRMGQLILTKGIPATDPFSYTMPSYPVVDHEWLSDVLLVKLYSVVGYAGLGVIFTVIATAALLLQWQIVRAHRRFAFIPFLLAIVTLYSFFGIRPQVISWFFFSLILVVTADLEKFRNWRMLLPFMFLLWANLHGGFPIGLVIFLLAYLYWIFKGKFSIFGSILLFLASVGSTFITPYGMGTWREVWMTMSDGIVRWTIAEWHPSFFNVSFPFWTFVVLSVLLIVRYRRKFTFLDVSLFFILLFLALSSLRHIPLWILAALPLTTQGLVFLSQEAAGVKYGKERFLKAFKVFSVIVCILLLPDVLSFITSLQAKEDYYPQKAVVYLHSHRPHGQIFSSYNWGGFLIWQLPEKKVFVDGRMPSWRWNAHIAGESDYAFNDYRKLIGGKLSFTLTTKKYNISMLLLPNEIYEKQSPFIEQIEDFEDSIGEKFNLPFFNKKSKNFAYLIAEAKRAGWVEVYKDDTAVIYQDKRIERFLSRG